MGFVVAMFLKLWSREPAGLWKVPEKGTPAITTLIFPDTCTAFLANVSSCHPCTPPTQHRHRYCEEKYQKGLACISLTFKLLWQLSKFPQTPGEKRKWAENNSVIKHASNLAQVSGLDAEGWPLQNTEHPSSVLIQQNPELMNTQITQWT